MKKTESIKIGRFRVKRRTKRVQGQSKRIKKSSAVSVALGLRFALRVFVVVALIGAVVMMGVNIENCTTTRRFGARAESALAPKTKPYKGMAVLETTSGRLLCGYHEDDRLPMASTTKIATAIVTIEEMGDLSQEFLVPDAAVGIEGSSMYLRHGEKLTLKDYLYGLMLPSGNDAAVALSIIVSGSEDAFKEKLNALGAKLGLENTNFVTASGLHHEEHYTSARDLAKLTAYAMKNPSFREIVGTSFVTIKGSDPEIPRHLKNKQKLMNDEGLKSLGVTVTGVKSGFTPEAGRCLVTSANANGMEIIVVVLNAPEMFEETAKLITEIVGDYKMVDILTPKTHISKIMVSGSDTQEINIYSSGGFAYPLTAEERGKVRIKYDYPEQVVAPVLKDQEIGVVEISLNGVQIFKTPICSIEAANESRDNIIKKIIENF